MLEIKMEYQKEDSRDSVEVLTAQCEAILTEGESLED